MTLDGEFVADIKDTVSEIRHEYFENFLKGLPGDLSYFGMVENRHNNMIYWLGVQASALCIAFLDRFERLPTRNEEIEILMIIKEEIPWFKQEYDRIVSVRTSTDI